MKLALLLAFLAPGPFDEFDKHIADYEKVRKAAHDKMPRLKPTSSPSTITDYQNKLARRIREARQHARQGEIFTPTVAPEFLKLIATALHGPDGPAIRVSLARAEPVQSTPRVNHPYPEGAPLQSTPPSLLLNLPKLPPNLDYRLLGRDLVLRDTEANLIIDVLPNAIP